MRTEWAAILRNWNLKSRQPQFLHQYEPSYSPESPIESPVLRLSDQYFCLQLQTRRAKWRPGPGPAGVESPSRATTASRFPVRKIGKFQGPITRPADSRSSAKLATIPSTTLLVDGKIAENPGKQITNSNTRMF